MNETLQLQPSSKEEGRNYGIDLLRLVSMFLVVLLHTTGAVRKAADPGTPLYNMIYLLRTISYPCVDIFAIISGYVGWKHRLHFSGIAGTWLQVVWHTLLITVLTALIRPDWMPENAWTKALLPVSHKEYWYVTAYFMMLLFIPLIHFILRHIPTWLLWIWVSSFLFVHSFLSTLNWKAYGMKRGYNFYWLIGMYLLGAALEQSKKLWQAHARAVGLILFITGIIPAYLFIVLADNRNWIDYCSPFTILSAVGCVICFSGLQLEKLSDMIRILSPTALAVFVIHVHTIPWNHIFYSFARKLGLWDTVSVSRLCINIFGWALIIFASCVLLDLIRIGIFRLFGIDKGLHSVDGWLDRLREKVLKRQILPSRVQKR